MGSSRLGGGLQLAQPGVEALAQDGGGGGHVRVDQGGLAHALRDWALADPQRHFLVYGTPVPGYHAPDDTTEISSEIMTTLLDACAARTTDGPTTPFTTHLEGHRDWAEGHPASPAALRQALAFWTRLHGALSLELAGHFAGMDLDPALLCAAELDDLPTPDA
ncbi:TetR family transcriptional regulator [Streptomyces noursei]|nr:TetR family transcriptional regulator [Streptomyces noursei]